jgi:putative membrane protein
MGVATSLSTFPNFIIYFITAVVLTAVFVVLYANLTPHREIRLIREGNSAAAVALIGGLLGFVIPLGSVISHSAVLTDVVIWGVVALVVQVGGFLVARLVLPHLPQAIENGNVSDAIFLGGLSLSLGILDAACMAG